MMTKVCNLQEIVSAIPPSEDNPRKFTIVPNYPLWVDLSKAVVARTFNGQLLFEDEKDRTLYKPETFVEIYWDGTLCVTTMFTPEVQRELVGFLGDKDMTSKSPHWKNPKVKDDGNELPYNERKALPSKDNDNKKENEAWN
jgi:hypothetical protein